MLWLRIAFILILGAWEDNWSPCQRIRGALAFSYLLFPFSRLDNFPWLSTSFSYHEQGIGFDSFYFQQFPVSFMVSFLQFLLKMPEFIFELAFIHFHFLFGPFPYPTPVKLIASFVGFFPYVKKISINERNWIIQFLEPA